jgi:hypothetical protein
MHARPTHGCGRHLPRPPLHSCEHWGSQYPTRAMCCTPAGHRRTGHAPAAGGLTWHAGSPLSQPCLPLVSAGMSPCIASDWCAPSPGPEHEQLQGAKCRRLKPAVLASEPCCVTSLVCRSLAPNEWEPNLCRGESGRGELCTYISVPDPVGPVRLLGVAAEGDVGFPSLSGIRQGICRVPSGLRVAGGTWILGNVEGAGPLGLPPPGRRGGPRRGRAVRVSVVGA